MKSTVFAVAFLLGSSSAFAQMPTTHNHQMSSAPADARYEFVQSQVAAKGTFRLDKFRGAVNQIQQSSPDGDISWVEIPRREHPADKRQEGKVNYQLFTSGIAMRFTFLMNVNTGATWQLVESPEKVMVWVPVP